MRYTLSAAFDRSKDRPMTVNLDASTDEQAMFESLDVIMDRAYEDTRGVWAIGHIQLVDPNGVILHEMEAK